MMRIVIFKFDWRIMFSALFNVDEGLVMPDCLMRNWFVIKSSERISIRCGSQGRLTVPDLVGIFMRLASSGRTIKHSCLGISWTRDVNAAVFYVCNFKCLNLSLIFSFNVCFPIKRKKINVFDVGRAVLLFVQIIFAHHMIFNHQRALKLIFFY